MHTILIKTLAVLSLGAMRAHGAQLNLRYEWADSPAGPFSAIPTDQLRIQADGSVSVATDAPRAFFQLLVNQGGTAGGSGGASVPVRTLDSLPAETQVLLQRTFEAIAGDGSQEAGGWRGAHMTPFVTPVTSAWNETGVPDMVEIKLTAECTPPAPGGLFPAPEGEPFARDRGFILASLSRKNPPIVGYATEGLTPCELLLSNCRSGPVTCIRRFGPMCVAAENASKDLLGQRGLFPMVFPDQTYADGAQRVSYAWDSEAVEHPPLPAAPRGAAANDYASFRALTAGYNDSAFLKARRAQREALIEFDWLALEGRAPALAVTAGETKSFLEGQAFTRFMLDDEDTARPAVVTLGGAGGGLSIQGIVPGAYRLTLIPATGMPQRFLVQVRGPGQQARNGATGLCSTSKVWEAGTEAQQPRYSQRADLGRWCDSVGCGPVMLAIMFAWAEHNQNVPSAFWERTLSDPLSVRRASLREVDSPTVYISGVTNTRMRDWYDYLKDECNVACWPHNGSGSSLPWDVGSTLIDYLDYAASNYLPLFVAQDPGGPLTGGGAQWENDVWGDDWDEAGVHVANAIKAGRPGGVYYMEHWHYAVAWRYRKTVYEIKVNNTVLWSATDRFFRVNTGWGTGPDKDAVWNAYDIDGCFLLNMWQKRQLANP